MVIDKSFLNDFPIHTYKHEKYRLEENKAESNTSGTKGMQIFNEMIKHINKSKEFSEKKVHFNRSQNFRIIIKWKQSKSPHLKIEK